jgi:hypothetical protein
VRGISKVPKGQGVHKWAKALLAVLLGNLAYFAVMPKLPLPLRHVPFRLDLGLLLDCCFCTVVFLLVSRVWRHRDR